MVELGARRYPILFRMFALDELVARLHALAITRRLLLITDSTVDALHGAPLVAGLEGAGLTITRCVVAPGEASKSVECAARLWDLALTGGVDRLTPVVAFGGGVVGDLAGFVASTLLRGLPLVQVPTTVMAQVDSSVGGKTALNHAVGKNLVGTFHQPRFVFSDAGYLETLPAREIRSGLAEVVKSAAIAAPELLDVLAGPDVALGKPDALGPLVRAAVAIKAELVAADELENGARALLNFGHTVGHAFEAAAGFSGLTHGESISLGMCAAVALSERLSGLPPAEADRLVAVLGGLGLPTDWRLRFGPEVLALIARDKKARGDRVHAVLLRLLGEPEVIPIHFKDLAETLTALAVLQTRKTT